MSGAEQALERPGELCSATLFCLKKKKKAAAVPAVLSRISQPGVSLAYVSLIHGSPSGSVIKRLLPTQETQVRFLGQGDPLEKEW